jgi:hypothetical protein
MNIFERRGISFAYGKLIGWIIALIVLALVIGFGILLSGKGGDAIGFLKDILRFG